MFGSQEQDMAVKGAAGHEKERKDLFTKRIDKGEIRQCSGYHCCLFLKKVRWSVLKYCHVHCPHGWVSVAKEVREENLETESRCDALVQPISCLPGLNVCVSSKVIYWHCALSMMVFAGGAIGRSVGHEDRAFVMELMLLQKRRRWLSASQGADSYQTLSLSAPSSWTLEPPKMWEINIYCVRRLVVTFCYSSLGWLRHCWCLLSVFGVCPASSPQARVR